MKNGLKITIAASCLFVQIGCTTAGNGIRSGALSDMIARTVSGFTLRPSEARTSILRAWPSQTGNVSRQGVGAAERRARGAWWGES